MKSIAFLSIFAFFLFGILPSFAQTAPKNSISFLKRGKSNTAPPTKESNTLTRTSGTEFNFVGSWCVISEIGFDGDEVINDIYSTGQCMVWFNEDGTYVVSNYRDHDIFLRRWWYLGDNIIGDSDCFIISLISYEDGIFTGHIINTEEKGYSTTVVMKRDNKISLSIGKGFGYLKDNETKYIVGASADGETQLRIDVKSIVDNYAAYDVTFSSDYGNTEEICGTANDFKKTGESTAEFLYTVPKEYPFENGFFYMVNMTLTLYDANQKAVTYGELPIKIVRPPVLCVHGLNDYGTCFASFTGFLYRSGCYLPFQLYRSDYHPTSCMEFSTNQNVVPKDLKKLFLNCYQQGIIASKADIIGHSMGGLLSRMYIQNVSQQGVNRLITLNTPHFGSQGASLIVNDCKPYVFQELGKKIFGEDSGAVNDLQVNSIAMTNLARSSNQLKGIPIHTVCTDYTCSSVAETGVGTAVALIAAIKLLCKMKGLTPKPFMINELAELIYKGPSDLVVSLTSQKGGLSNNHTSIFKGDDHNYCHVLTPNMFTIQAHLKSLLTKPKNEQTFSTNGLIYKVEPNLDESDIQAVYKKIFLYYPNNTFSSVSTTTRSSSSIMLKKCELDDSRRLNVTCETSPDIENYVIIVSMEDGTAFIKDELSFQEPISSEYGGVISIYAMAYTASGEIISDAANVKANHVLDETQYEYAEFENTDALLIFKGESIAPLLNLRRTDGQSELILPDQYYLPDLGEKPNNFVEIKNGRIYGVSEGSGLLIGTASSFSAEILYKVIDPSSIELSDGTETGIEMMPSINNRDKEGVVNFTFSPKTRTGNVSFAKTDLSTILVQIYDINGKLRKSFMQQPQNSTLILDFLPSGIYIIRFAEKTLDETFKFIIP